MGSNEEQSFNIYGPEHKRYINKIGVATACVAIMSIALTALFVFTNSRFGLYFVAAVWSVLPPIWFWYEYYFLYQKHGNHQEFEKFKYGQVLSKSVWVGLGAVLIAAVALIEK